MRCEEARIALRPDPPATADTPDMRAALGHYQACPACRQFFRANRLLTERLARLRGRMVSPDGLLERAIVAVTREAQAEEATRRARRLMVAGGGLLAAAAVLALFSLGRPTMPAELALPIVAEARSGLVGDSAMASDEFGDVEAFLQQHLGYEVQVPRIRDATLVGGRVLRLDATPTAVAVYTYNGMPLTYFALRSRDVMGTRVVGSHVRAVSSDGYAVVVWEERGQARVVAAPMPRADVVEIAKECRNMAAMRLRT